MPKLTIKDDRAFFFDIMKLLGMVYDIAPDVKLDADLDRTRLLMKMAQKLQDTIKDHEATEVSK